MPKFPKPSLAGLVLLAVFLVLPTAISSSGLRPSSSSSSLRRLNGFGFGGIGDFFDEVFGSGSDNENGNGNIENENEGSTGDNNNSGNDPWNVALGGLNDALDGIGEVAGDLLPNGSENDNDNENNAGSDLLGNNDLLAFVPTECMDNGPELDNVVECVAKPTNLFGCLGLLGALDPDAIPDPAGIEECSDIEEPFCAVVAECEGCGVEIDALMRCIVVYSPGVDGNITDLVETCPLDCAN